ncbi:methyl-accepting chemotaxis protein [Clostridium sp. LBM24168]
MKKMFNFKFVHIFSGMKEKIFDKLKEKISAKKKKINLIDLSFLNSVGIKIIAQIGVLVIAICGVIGLISYHSSYTAMEQNIKSSLQDKAGESSKLIDSMLQQQVKAMIEIANRTEIRSMDPKIQIPVLAKRAEELNYSSLNVMDLNGLAYMQTGGKTNIDLNSNESAYLKTALQGKPKIDGPYFNVNGDQIIAVAVPIKNDNNKIVGVLFSNISTAELNKLVQRMKVGASGYCFIIDKSGNKVIHKNLTLVLNKDNTIKNAEKDKSLIELSNLEKKMIQGKSGSGYYKENGKYMLLAYSPIPEMNWYLGITIAKEEVFISVNVLKYKMITATIIFILIGIFIGSIIARQIRKPLVKIRKYAEELSNFNLEYKIDIKSKDEFGQTVNDLNSALENIGNMIRHAKKGSCTALESSNYVNQMFQESQVDIETVSNMSDEITTNMQETLVSIENVGEKVCLVKQMVEKTVDEASAGLNLSDEMNKKAVYIRDNIEKSRENLKIYYTESSKKLKNSLETIKVVNNISKMLNEIRKVSKKTNILALNAHIEAARAGEFGRGFMVVAGEVKKLADQSSNMANNIQINIKDIMMAVGELIDSSKNILQLIEENVMDDYVKIIEMSKEYQDEGMKIESVIKKFYVLTDDINLSQQEFSNIIDDITNSVGKCTEAVINISGSMNSIEEKNTDISVKTAQNADEAKKLIDIVDQFKVQD